MGSNATQAQGVLLFLLAFTLIAAGLAADISYIAVLAGVLLLAGSAVLFVKCKPWEHNEE
jgi:riboflavin transporter FmnP